MAKTTFSDTPPLGTIVTAAFLNAVNNHRHTGEDVDGAGALDYAADAGAANAYAITLSPALTGHVTGMPIYFKAANANTGASTINVNGLGAIAIKKHGALALAAGDIAAGQIVGVAYDGTNYQILGGGDSFSASLALPGYQKLPSGLIIQWGQAVASAQGRALYTMPITFPTAFLLGMVCDITANDAEIACAVGDGSTTSQIQIYAAAGTNTINYIALGY